MHERLQYLLEAHLENRLTDSEASELQETLRTSEDARQAYWEYVEQHNLIEDVLSESRGRDLALAEDDSAAASTFESSLTSVSSSPSAANRWHIWAWTGAFFVLAASLLLALGLGLRSKTDPNPTPDSSSVPVATVRSLTGDVQVVDVSGKKKAAHTNSPLTVGQAVHVGDDESRAEVFFRDGSRVTVGSGTNVRFPDPEGKKEKRVHLEKGAVQVRVNEQDAKCPMIVTTDHARVTTLGTRFRLYREEKASRLELEEGKVRLECATSRESMELGEGSFVIATDGPLLSSAQPLAVKSCCLRHTFLGGGNIVRFSPDGRQLIASHHSRGWKLWNTLDGKLLATAPGIGQWTSDLTFTKAKDMVVALGNRGTATIWKIGEPQSTTTKLRQKRLRSEAVSDDGRWLAQGTSDREVAIWEVDAEQGRISLHRSLPIQPTRIALSRDGPHVAVSRWAGEIHIFEVQTGREVAQYKLKRTPTPIALSADNRFLAAHTNADGLVLFHQKTGDRQTVWSPGGARVRCLTFSADGRVLLAGLNDGTVRAWSTNDGKSLLIFDTGNRSVRSLDVTANLSRLATVGDGDCVKIWEWQPR